MLVRCMVDDQLRYDAQLALVRLADKLLEIGARSIGRMDIVIISDVVAVVFERRRIEWQQPNRVDAQVLDVVELLGKPAKVAYPVIVGVEECLDVQLVDDSVLVPARS